MRIAPLLLLVACGNPDTTFSNGTGNGDVADGTGRMEIDKTEIVISEIEGAFSKSEAFTITSVGDTNLLIYEIRIVADADDVFYFDEVENVELAPEQTVTYSVVAQLEVAEPSEGQLRVRTNDPDNAALIVPLKAWPQGYVPPEDTGGGGDTGDSGDTGTP